MADDAGLRDALTTEARRIEEDALYSAKGHWEAARTWEHLHYWIGIPTALVAAIAGVTSLTEHPVLASVLAFTVAATTGIATFLKTKERHVERHAAGTAFKALHNQARIFRELDCLSDKPVQELLEALKELDARRNALNSSSPQIARRAFLRARAGIERGEACYDVDENA